VPPTLDETNARIEKKERELADDRKAVDRARGIVRARSRAADEIEQALRDLHDDREHRRHIVKDLRDGYRHGGEEHGEYWNPQRIEDRVEVLADELDELEGEIGRLVNRLDVVGEHEKGARDRLEALVKDRVVDAKRLDHLRDVRRRMRVDHAGQLTPHFHVAEFDCHDGTPVPPAAVAALRDNCARYLEPLRAQFGVVHINSGYRDRAYNASIGGASNSVHIYDEHPAATAVDHWAEGADPPNVQTWHERNTYPDGMGRYSSFTHVDNRNRIGWPDSRWVGP
jgi:transposase